MVPFVVSWGHTVISWQAKFDAAALGNHNLASRNTLNSTSIYEHTHNGCKAREGGCRLLAAAGHDPLHQRLQLPSLLHMPQRRWALGVHTDAGRHGWHVAHKEGRRRRLRQQSRVGGSGGGRRRRQL